MQALGSGSEAKTLDHFGNSMTLSISKKGFIIVNSSSSYQSAGQLMV